MAIDSEAKRCRVMDLDAVASAAGLPLPTGTIDAAERAAFVWLYFVSAQLAREVTLRGRVFQRTRLP